MKTIKLLIATLTLFGATILVSCHGDNSGNNTDATSTEQSAEVSVYQCPMKCEGEKTYEKAGKCPDCGMDLEQVETKEVEENHEDHDH